MATTLTVLVPFLVYLVTLAPTIHWRDAGELAAAAATLGIPHPPGRPLYMLIGWLATHLPLGDVAYRLNLLSAACTAAAIVVLAVGARWIWSAAKPSDAADLPPLPTALAIAAGAWAFAFSAPTVTWATILEDYALLACLAGGLVVAMDPRGHESSRPLAPVALWLGLALAVHPAALFAVPAVLCGLGLGLTAPPRRGRDAAAAVAALAAGLAFYAYVPVRAAMRPAFDWEAARSLGEVWHYLVAGQYRFGGGPLGLPPLAALPERFWTVGLILWEEWGPASLALSLLGAGVLLWRAPAIGLTIEVFILGFCFLPTLAPTFETSRVMSGYRLPALWGLGLLAAAGGLALATGMARLARRAGLAGTASLVLLSAVSAAGLVAPVARGASSLPALSQRGVTAPRAFGEEILRVAPPRAIILVPQDDLLFILWYLRTVEGRRPDVAVLPSQWLTIRPQILARWHPDLVIPEPAGDRSGTTRSEVDVMQAFARANHERRPVLWAPPPAGAGPEDRIVLRGVMGIYAPEGARGADRQVHREHLARFGAAVVPPALVPGDVEGRRVLGQQLEAVARASARHQWPEEAILAATLARLLEPDRRDLAFLLVSLYRETGRLQGAVGLAEQLAAQDPTAPDILKTLADAYHAAGNRPGAIRALEALVRARPDEREARLNLAWLYAEAGRRTDARKQLETILRQFPEDREARHRLAALEAI